MDLILETNHIIKKYGNRTILNNINMKIQKGDIYGFIGNMVLPIILFIVYGVLTIVIGNKLLWNKEIKG